MSIKSCLQAALSIGLVLSLHLFSSAQTDPARIWEAVSENQVRSRGNRLLVPENYRVFTLDRAQFRVATAAAPMEFSEQARDGMTVIELPTPEGRLEKFRIVESPVMGGEALAEFPDWKTYQAYGIDEPTATARLGFTALGFHATIFSTRGTYQVDPYQTNDLDNYITYYKRDIASERKFHCKLDEEIGVTDQHESMSFFPAAEFSHGSQIRTYRVAIATSGEYTGIFANQTNGLAAVVITINRINGVYRKDFAVGLLLVSGTSLVFPDGATDPYVNTGSTSDLTANQSTLDAVLGSANYDFGHLFLTNDSGVATLNSVCSSSSKARGLSGQPNPQGDPFDVDYVAHEMGHQLGANHTFNSTANCNTSPAAARREPGSAVTIMGYAGICSSTSNIQRNSIDTFLGYNQQEVITFLGAGGSTCGTVAGSNSVPTVSVGAASYTIPYRTPFALTANASDGNGDALTYSWEWNTASGSTSSYPSTTDDDDTNLNATRPLMRPYSPTTSPTRTFPSLPYILNNNNEAPVTYTGTSATGSICAATCITGEDLPSVARTVNFRVTVRDNLGGVADATTDVAFVNTTTPFEVTSQSTPASWAVGSTQAVTWNVSGTNAAPINATQVRLRISLDGGQTFPLESAPVANDGSENIVIPNFPTTQGRVKVEAVGNVFFDINSAVITISGTTANIRAPFDYDGDDRTDISIFRSSLGQWWYQASFSGSVFAATFGSATDRIAPADFTGDGKDDFAFFRPGTGEWFVLRSTDFSFYSFPFGLGTDTHVSGDFDGDGKADPAVFRASTGTWFIQKSTGGTDIIGFGGAGDKPVVGDYDGDTKSDLAIYRAASGQWWIRRSSDGSVFVATFGGATDRPVQGYWTADTKTDIAFFRPGTGEWFVLRSEDLSFYSAPFGAAGDIPVPGDYDGDNRWDTAVFRPSTSTWFILRTSAGSHIQAFGAGTDTPTASAYVP